MPLNKHSGEMTPLITIGKGELAAMAWSIEQLVLRLTRVGQLWGTNLSFLPGPRLVLTFVSRTCWSLGRDLFYGTIPEGSPGLKEEALLVKIQ